MREAAKKTFLRLTHFKPSFTSHSAYLSLHFREFNSLAVGRFFAAHDWGAEKVTATNGIIHRVFSFSALIFFRSAQR